MLVSIAAFLRGRQGDVPQVRDDPNAFFVTAKMGVRFLYLSLCDMLMVENPKGKQTFCHLDTVTCASIPPSMRV